MFDTLLGHIPLIMICISSLISLMQEQVKKFSLLGLKTKHVGEGQGKDSIERVAKGQCQLVYISPELLLENLYWRKVLRSEVYQKNLINVCFVLQE